MLLVGLMPTYGRPARLLENAIACFEGQTHEERRLLICDDGGNFQPQTGDRWELVAVPDRFPSLPAKYDAMVGMALHRWPELAGFVVQDDDDVYCPEHYAAHAKILAEHGWSHPRHVWSSYTGSPLIEPASGRFHGALALRRESWHRVGGWLGVMPAEHELRADFDQRMLMVLAASEPGGYSDYGTTPTYCFRWASTGAGHCQGLMSTPDNETWYSRVREPSEELHGPLVPQFDEDTERTLRTIAQELAA